MMEIIPSSTNYYLAEVPQNIQMKFAFSIMTENLAVAKLLTPKVLCRDFLSDCLWTKAIPNILVKNYGIYGFHPIALPYGMDVYLYVEIDKPCKLRTSTNNLFEYLESRFGIKDLHFLKGNDHTNGFVKLPREYLETPLLFTWLTFLIRIGMHHKKPTEAKTFDTSLSLDKNYKIEDGDPTCTQDRTILRTWDGLNVLDRIGKSFNKLKDINLPLFKQHTFIKNINDEYTLRHLHLIHDNTGIRALGFARSQNEKYFANITHVIYPWVEVIKNVST